MPVRHAHVRADAVEPDEVFGAVTEAGVIVACYAHVGAEQRKATRAARQALGDGVQILTLLGSGHRVATFGARRSAGAPRPRTGRAVLALHEGSIGVESSNEEATTSW